MTGDAAHVGWRWGLRLVVREVHLQLRLFRRNPTAVLFTVALPMLTLPLVHAINRQAVVLAPGGELRDVAMQGLPFGEQGFVSFAQYLTPVAAAFGVAVACCANLAVRTTVARGRGAFRRVRGWPLPTPIYLLGHVGASVVIGLLLALGAVALGVFSYDVEIVARLLPAFIAALLVGTVSFAAIGLAVSALLPNADAAAPVAFGAMVPLGFLSNVFFPPHIAPEWMRNIGELLPLEPFAKALFSTFSPHTPSPGLEYAALAKVAAWGVVAALVVWWAWSERVPSDLTRAEGRSRA